MLGDNLKISAIMAGRSLDVTLLFEGLREIKLRIALQRSTRDGTLPAVDGFFGMAESLGEQAIIHESIDILRRAQNKLAVKRIGVRIAAGNDQAAGIRFLNGEIRQH